MTVMLLMSVGCGAKAPGDVDELRAFAAHYTEAWCSQDAQRVASFFGENGSLKINEGAASIGRSAINTVARGFMTSFPDMVVTMDSVRFQGDHAEYYWTLRGTNNGPEGTGKAVHISGYEEWVFSDDGLIAESRGHFDDSEYQRQLNEGVLK